MASTSRQVILALVGLAVAVAVVSGTSLRAGTRQNGDRLACSGNVDLRSSYNKVVSAQRICDLSAYRQIITQVLALDRGIGGRGGYANIIKGGPGSNNVTLYLWSQKSQPLNFTIQVYAKPRY